MLQEPSPETPVPFGKYQLIRRIGAGGMGEVYLARESSSRHGPRACVVKKVLPNLVENRAFVGRFLDESKVVVRLKHQNIARVYAMGDVDGEYYLTMEYVQGKTVSRFTRRLRDRRIEMPLGLILLLGEKVCEGLAYAHSATGDDGSPLHLVHRDLSPANVCISYRGEVKIIDFGAAQSTLKEEQTAPRVVIGNLTYMAPEQAKKQLVDGRADVYSTGVMLWELLSWHALPQKGDPVERWRKAANPTWEAPSLTRKSVPADVDEIVLRSLKKDPNERYANAAELADALKRARLRHAPDVNEKDLGDLLSRVFQKEKQAEDAVLAEVVYGRTPVEEKTRRVQVVPPTALAFEHTAVMAPADFLPRDDVTDPGRPGPQAPAAEEPLPLDKRKVKKPEPIILTTVPEAQPPPAVNAARTSFGVTFEATAPRVERSLIEEIEAISPGGDAYDDDDNTRPWTTLSAWQKALLFTGVFAVATGLGFLAVWLSLKP